MNKYAAVIALALLTLQMSCQNAGPEHRSHTVEIKNMKFEPSVVEVSKGDTIVWLNVDMVDHDVTEQPAEKWKSPILRQGERWMKVVDESSDYFCSIHVVMKGRITMK